MNLFLYLFYQAAKALTRLVLGVFYAKTVVTNRKNLAYQNPGIVVSNHPNALLDPLHVASRTQKIQFFLANITMFQHPISNWFFSTFYCIPIERPKDIQGRGVQNKASFEKCDEFLTGGGSLYIAPQGAMELKRRIEKVKTGTARIALSAEQKNDFQLGMTILPVGLNYSAANDFRSQLLINVGEPLLIKDYAQAYQQDPIQTVRQLTADLKSRMGELIITTQDEAEDELLYQIETLQATNEPLEMSPTFKRSKQTLKQLRAFDEQNPTGYQALK
ncbi:MAG: 1-acyl-sn-glycerol-3-phosphate acyltransferase, partial [Bacteroidota bacterium]